MDDSEKLVEEFLIDRGFSNVIYEPDGKVPPDFLVNGRIAVEVRRLNQNEEMDEGYRGLEEVAIPLKVALRKIASSAKSVGPFRFR